VSPVGIVACQPARRHAVGAAVVHVYVQVGAVPAPPGEVAEWRQGDPKGGVVAGANGNGAALDPGLGATRHLDRVLAGRQREQVQAGGVEIPVFEAPLASERTCLRDEGREFGRPMAGHWLDWFDVRIPLGHSAVAARLLAGTNCRATT